MAPQRWGGSWCFHHAPSPPPSLPRPVAGTSITFGCAGSLFLFLLHPANIFFPVFPSTDFYLSPLFPCLSIYLSFSLLFLVFPLLRPTSFPCVRVPRQRGEGKRGGTRKREARRETRKGGRKRGDGEVNKGGKGNKKESKNGIRERRMGGRKGKGD